MIIYVLDLHIELNKRAGMANEFVIRYWVIFEEIWNQRNGVIFRAKIAGVMSIAQPTMTARMLCQVSFRRIPSG